MGGIDENVEEKKGQEQEFEESPDAAGEEMLPGSVEPMVGRV